MAEEEKRVKFVVLLTCSLTIFVSTVIRTIDPSFLTDRTAGSQ